MINLASGGGSNTLTSPNLECFSMISSISCASDLVVGPKPSENDDKHIEISHPLPNKSSAWNSTPLSRVQSKLQSFTKTRDLLPDILSISRNLESGILFLSDSFKSFRAR